MPMSSPNPRRRFHRGSSNPNPLVEYYSSSSNSNQSSDSTPPALYTYARFLLWTEELDKSSFTGPVPNRHVQDSGEAGMLDEVRMAFASDLDQHRRAGAVTLMVVIARSVEHPNTRHRYLVASDKDKSWMLMVNEREQGRTHIKDPWTFIYDALDKSFQDMRYLPHNCLRAQGQISIREQNQKVKAKEEQEGKNLKTRTRCVNGVYDIRTYRWTCSTRNMGWDASVECSEFRVPGSSSCSRRGEGGMGFISSFFRPVFLRVLLLGMCVVYLTLRAQHYQMLGGEEGDDYEYDEYEEM